MGGSSIHLGYRSFNDNHHPPETDIEVTWLSLSDMHLTIRGFMPHKKNELKSIRYDYEECLSPGGSEAII